MTDRTFSVVAPNGQSVVLDTEGGGPYGLQVTSRGIGWPAKVNQYAESAGDGGVNVGSKYGMRALDLTVLTLGTSRADIEAKLNTLGRIVDPQQGQSRLVCTFQNGQAWDLPFDYNSGLEGDGTESGPTYSRNTLSLTAPKPFWVSRQAVQFRVAVPADIQADLVEDLAELPVAPSTVLGEVTVTNPGDVPSPVTWIIRGPADGASISFGGAGFSFDEPIADGDEIRITTKPVRVTNLAGDNVYNALGTAPKFRPIPPGQTTLQLQMVNATGDASISGFFNPRRKAMY